MNVVALKRAMKMNKQDIIDSISSSPYNYPFDDHFVTYVKVIGDVFLNPELLEV
jgi:hypothetical protein